MSTVTICGLNDEGEGIFYLEGKEKSVPFVLPGEIVEVSSDRKGRNWFLDHITQSNQSRVTPLCPYFTRCGGCTLQHIERSMYEEIKTGRVRRAVQDLCDISPLVKLASGQRRRANLEAIKKEDQTYLGFHRLKSHQIIQVDLCPALSPALRVLLLPLKHVLHEILGHKQKAQIFMLESDTGIDLALEINFVTCLTDSQRDLLKHFAKEHKVTRLFFRYRKLRDVIYEIGPIQLRFDTYSVPIDAYGFAQATKEADCVLAKLVIDAVPPKPKRIADLFSGRGTFSFPLARNGAVDAYEFDPYALKDLEAISPPFTVIKRDLFANPLTSQELNVYDVVVLDPPRAGAEAQVQELVKSKVFTIIYVSCNPASFGQDAHLLSKHYDLKTVTPVDQFAWTAHLEVVGVFQTKR